ncbi:MAG: tyrosine-type recombinase/integrase [Anaerolineales bacterium]|nr:tyrosine-type recombinase/integrase [Anaerolineales bacterium]
MNYATSTNFLYTRDISITWIVRDSDLPLKLVLGTRRLDVLWDHSSLLLHDVLICPTPPCWPDYIDLRDRLFPEAEPLFPTVDGNLYRPVKYLERLKKMLSDARQDTSLSHPKEMTEEQLQAVANLHFLIQRQAYQATLALAFCSLLGMRPSEVAKLEKRDVDFSARLLHLRDTKSQEDQKLPLLTCLEEPLQRYTMYLADAYSPLFVNSKGRPWERRDASRTIAQWGVENNIRCLTPRKLRASLGSMLSRMKVEPSLVALILRHKDPATALRHYNEREIQEAFCCLEGVGEAFDTHAVSSGQGDYDHVGEMTERHI